MAPTSYFELLRATSSYFKRFEETVDKTLDMTLNMTVCINLERERERETIERSIGLIGRVHKEIHDDEDYRSSSDRI